MKCFEDDCVRQAVPPGNYCSAHGDKKVWIPAMRRIDPTILERRINDDLDGGDEEEEEEE